MSLLSRHFTLLLAVVLAQVVLLAWQVKDREKNDARLIRTWAITAVTPLARLLEEGRGGVTHFFRDYFQLSSVRIENQRMQGELDRLKIENQRLRGELEMADRVRALDAFQRESPFKFVGARIISSAPGAGAKVVYLDRGSTSGVQKGMPVMTPDGLVGRVQATYPTAAQVTLINDPAFAAGVISQRHRVKGVVRGQGHAKLLVDYVQLEEKVEMGEIFFTSGEDRLLPKGLPVGKAVSLRKGAVGKREIDLEPIGFREGLEEVLVLVGGGHQPLPEFTAPETSRLQLLAPPGDAAEGGNKFELKPGEMQTEADRVRQQYKVVESWNGGAGFGNGGRLPNFTVLPRPDAAPPADPAKPAAVKPESVKPPETVKPPEAAKPPAP
jgi:rod shape-determining protein MreC